MSDEPPFKAARTAHTARPTCASHRSGPPRAPPSSHCPSLAAPQVLPTPLPQSLVSAWCAELREAASQDERSHWWAEAHWCPLSACSSDTLLGSTVSHVLAQLDGEARTAIAGVEFWTQRRALDAGLHLHWDCDQERGRVSGELDCPLRSAIVYLTDDGGPTVLIDRTPESHASCEAAAAEPKQGGQRCWLVWPHAGQIATFPGNMLHGVLPYPFPGDHDPKMPLRQTVLLNLWMHRPMQLAKLPSMLAPRRRCSRKPHPVSGASTCKREVEVAELGYNCRRLPLVTGRVHRHCWSRVHSEMWGETILTLGMFDRTEYLEIQIPPIVYRNAQVEEFIASVRCVSLNCCCQCSA
ncbi:hypothetical protein AB1Y20_009760 [Prymnesium parvum]|uniref:Uncharacterized protein n=1 Tax=Prymnesium parvum TaxID=97485 RepID=A0AB34K2E5_PRYPA